MVAKNLTLLSRGKHPLAPWHFYNCGTIYKCHLTYLFTVQCIKTTVLMQSTDNKTFVK